MKKGIIIGIMLVLIHHLPAAAEFYRYKDAHGNTIYTDDFSKVPPDQRKEVKAYDDHISRSQSDLDKKSPDNIDLEAATNDDHKKEGMRLIRREEALTKEYDGLKAEREALDNVQKAAVTKAQIKEYNKKVIDFNTRLKAYKEKENAHTAEVKEFNKRVETKETDQPPQQ